LLFSLRSRSRENRPLVPSREDVCPYVSARQISAKFDIGDFSALEEIKILLQYGKNMVQFT